MHVAAALRQGLQLQLQPGPWVNSVVGVFRHGLLRALVGTNPWDLVLYGSARDSAWLCDAAALEAVLAAVRVALPEALGPLGAPRPALVVLLPAKVG